LEHVNWLILELELVLERKHKSEQVAENSKTVIQNALRKAFSPEFLNRVDDMIIFHH
jgi:ATP-dependent Clp protease ATP-binding subunit ClpA